MVQVETKFFQQGDSHARQAITPRPSRDLARRDFHVALEFASSDPFRDIVLGHRCFFLDDGQVKSQ